MILELSKNEHLTILKPIGDLDASSSVQVDEALAGIMTDNAKSVAIDCSGINYISSAGLGVFISYLSEMESKNIKIVFYGMSDKIYNVFEMVGLSKLITIEKDLNGAQVYLNA